MLDEVDNVESRQQHLEELAGIGELILALRSEVKQLRNDHESMIVELMSLKSYIFENMTAIEKVVEPPIVLVNGKSPDEGRGIVKKQKIDKGKMNRIPLNQMLSKAKQGKKTNKDRGPIISDESE